MIPETCEDYFSRVFRKLENDSKFKAECALLELTELICEMHGQPKGLKKIYYKILEWCATKLIWQDKERK